MFYVFAGATDVVAIAAANVVMPMFIFVGCVLNIVVAKCIFLFSLFSFSYLPILTYSYTPSHCLCNENFCERTQK